MFQRISEYERKRLIQEEMEHAVSNNYNLYLQSIEQKQTIGATTRPKRNWNGES